MFASKRIPGGWSEACDIFNARNIAGHAASCKAVAIHRSRGLHGRNEFGPSRGAGGREARPNDWSCYFHAARVVPAHDREALEKLCRYGLRPQFSQERLSRRSGGGKYGRARTGTLRPTIGARRNRFHRWRLDGAHAAGRARGVPSGLRPGARPDMRRAASTSCTWMSPTYRPRASSC